MTNVEHLELGELRPGDRIDAKYEVQYVLGRGGMGVVVAAIHLDLQELVALKFLLPKSVLQPDAVDRFLREARSVRKLRSEHVVKVLDVGRLSSTGLPYMAMELLHGEDLCTQLMEEGPLSMGMACDVIIQACDAIGEAHSLGIVHRDLKPANLFALSDLVDGRKFIKVLDFGIAKVLDPEQGGGTRAQTVMGSAYYMSPEQLRSTTNVDGRTDIWALGVTLYELLTGQHPFGGASILQLVYSVSSSSPTPPRTYRRELPAKLEEIVLRCLEKSPERRFATAGALASALAEFAGHHTTTELANRFSSRASFVEIPSSTRCSRPDSLEVDTAPAPNERAIPDFGLETLALASSETPLVVPVDPPRRHPSARRVVLGSLGVIAIAATLMGAFWPVAPQIDRAPVGVQGSARANASNDDPLATLTAASQNIDSNAASSTALGDIERVRVAESASTPPSYDALPNTKIPRKKDPAVPSRRLPGQSTRAPVGPVRPNFGNTVD